MPNPKFAAVLKTLAGAATAILLAVSATAQAAALVIPGSGSPELILRELADAFNATRNGHQVTIPPSSGTAGGIRAVESGEAMMARVARALTPDEIKTGLRYLGFARDAVVFAVGADVKLRALSSGQMADIFSGKVTNWNEVGGAPARIRLLTRENSETSLQAIRQHVPPFKALVFAPHAKLLNHDYEMIAMLDRYESAVGFLTRSSLAGATTGVKAVALDGAAPTPNNVAEGKYGLLVEYGLVYRDGRMSQAARRFADYVFADGGRRVLMQHGLAPVARK